MDLSDESYFIIEVVADDSENQRLIFSQPLLEEVLRIENSLNVIIQLDSDSTRSENVKRDILLALSCYRQPSQNATFDSKQTIEIQNHDQCEDVICHQSETLIEKELHHTHCNGSDGNSVENFKNQLKNHMNVKNSNQNYEPVKPVKRYSCKYCSLSFTKPIFLPGHDRICKEKRLIQETDRRNFTNQTASEKITNKTSLINNTYIDKLDIEHERTETLKDFISKELHGNICHISTNKTEVIDSIHKTKDKKVYVNSYRVAEKNISCEECGKMFYRPCDLKLHSLTHSNLRPYDCAICGKLFKDTKILFKHKRIHGDKPYICNYCDKTFAQKGQLNYHLRKHSGVRSFKCDTCDKSYFDARHLKSHKLLHKNI